MSVNESKRLGTVDGSNPFSGILGSILGESPAVQEARLDEASRVAKDLSSLVKKKRPFEAESSHATGAKDGLINGKRIKTSEASND